jgi:steroid 5-alpha reductase family enzyme
MDYAPLFAINAALVLGAVLALWLLSLPLRDASIIDMAFSGILAAVGAASFAMAAAVGPLQWLLLGMVATWALRMSGHLVARNWGHGEDPRYTRLRQWVDSDRAFAWLSLRQVFLLQGAVIYLVALPLQVGMLAPADHAPGWLAAAGAALWGLGLLFETVADWQLMRFRADPERRGTVLDTGLWRYSRHPNYFGELCVWWGIFLVACEAPWGPLTVVGPLAYSYLVVNVTGQRTLDKKLAREKPAYRSYMERTSGLIPLPPRRLGA